MGTNPDGQPRKKGMPPPKERRRMYPELLRKYDGNCQHIAEAMGWNYATVRSDMRRMGLNVPQKATARARLRKSEIAEANLPVPKTADPWNDAIVQMDETWDWEGEFVEATKKVRNMFHAAVNDEDKELALKSYDRLVQAMRAKTAGAKIGVFIDQRGGGDGATGDVYARTKAEAIAKLSAEGWGPEVMPQVQQPMRKPQRFAAGPVIDVTPITPDTDDEEGDDE